MEQMFFPVTQKKASKTGVEWSSVANKNAIFPTQLRDLRREKGVSQDELSKILGVSKSTLGLWETGDTLPDARSLHDLAVYYGVSADYLLGLTDVQTSDTNIKAICEYTGLHADTVVFLHGYLSATNQRDNVIISFYRRFFDDVVMSHSIGEMCGNILLAGEANAIANMIDESSTENDNTLRIDGAALTEIINDKIGIYPLPAKKASNYFLLAAQEIAKSNIDQSLADIMDDYSAYLEDYYCSDSKEYPDFRWPIKTK